MKKTFKKIVSGILAASLAFCMPLAGNTKTDHVYAADNNPAFAVPIQFPGIIPAEGVDWAGLSQTIMSVDIADVEKFSDSYFYSFKVFIPKEALKKNQAGVVVDPWFDFSTGDEYYGTLDGRYEYQIINDNNNIFPVIWDKEKEQALVQPEEYESFFHMDEAGDFYVLTITDASARDKICLAGDGDQLVPVDTTLGGNLSMRILIGGHDKKLSSIAYFDDLTVKAGDSIISQIDFSSASMYERHYEYVVGEDRDENRVERPALVNLNTNLLKLSKSSATVKAGKTVNIKASAAAGAKITYKSSNKKIATVTNKGVVKGIKAGKATITVSANGISKKFKVTVKKK